MPETNQDVVIILGATGAVGRCLTQTIPSEGVTVVAAGRNTERLQNLSGQGIETVECDASQPGTIGAAIENAGKIGTVRGIVNCIGSILLKPAHLTTDEEFHSVLQTNLMSSFEVLRAGAKVMRSHGGSIVFASTAAARIGIPSHEAIAAAKAGVEGMARSAAATYARYGIRINVVAPGLVKSEMSRQIWDNESAAAASRDMHALGRLGEPSDVASLIQWLLDPQNSWITGQIIAIDGGLSSVVQRQKR